MRFTFFISWVAVAFIITAAAEASVGSAERTARAVEALDRGDRSAARALLSEATAADPADSEAWYHTGRLALLEKDYASAVTALEQARTLGYPDSFALGVAYRGAGRLQDAEAALRQSLDYQPRNLEARYVLGLLLAETGRKAEAQPHLDAAKANPGLRAKVVAWDDAGAQGPKPWFLNIDVLHQTDSNVILAQTDLAAAQSTFSNEEISKRAGSRAVALIGAGYAFAPAGNNRLAIDYAGYQSYHYSSREILQAYDVSSHKLSLRDAQRWGKWSGSVALSGAATLLGPVAGAQKNGGSTPEAKGYSRAFAARPDVRYALTGAQSLGLSYEYGVERFAEGGGSLNAGGGLVYEMNRGNDAHAFTLSHAYGFLKRGYVVSSLGGAIVSGVGDNNMWDHQAGRMGVRALLPIGGRLGLLSGAGYTKRVYEAEVFPVAVGTPEKRSDDELGGELSIRYDWGRMRGQAGVSVLRNLSSVGAYDYRRTIFSIGLGASL